MFGLFVAISLFEIVTGVPKVFQLMNDPDARAPGDYRFDPLGLGGSMDLQEREISNGRLAMMAFSGIVTQAVITVRCRISDRARVARRCVLTRPCAAAGGPLPVL